MAAEMTVTRLQDRIRRSLGWRRLEDWPQELEPHVIANEAGEWLYSIEDWNCLNRPIVDLSLVAGQTWIDLPADFGRLIGGGIPAATGYAGGIVLEDMAAVLNARAGPSGGLPWVGCILHTSPGPTGPRSRARLEIGPAPNASTPAALRLAYRAGWVEVTDASDHIPVVPWMNQLYVEVATAIVGGREQEEDGTLLDRLDRLLQSSVFLAVKNHDASIQTDFGQMRGGVGETFPHDETPISPRRAPAIVGSNAF